VDAAEALGAENVRSEIEDFPEVSEVEAIRHFTRLSTWNHAIDYGMYPLGSCTMKYNPRINELVARIEGLAWAHPYQPEALAQGSMGVMARLESALAEITGMDAVTLQPAAGAHGELTGILLIRALLEKRGNPRKKILIPDSAHGTNPATAAIAGYAVENVKSSDSGVLDVSALEHIVTNDVAALMVTNPNTLGVFEENIIHVAEILHAKGAMLYMDGANMNALVGIARPGDFGVDVLHLNLHKTFSTPHGGGGPGAGPVAVKKAIEPFLPTPRLRRAGKKWAWDYKRKHSIGRVRSFYGNFGVLVRALAYILAHGGDGLRNATMDAVLNAVYIRKKLEPYFDLPYPSPNMHEVVFSDDRQAKSGVRTGDLAKRLIDYGFHPYTVSFPLIVHGALMIEPTETESKLELDQFIEAMIDIAKEVESDPQMVKNAPYGTRTSRVDEVTAARKPVLRWKAS
jgi:glycine cleavage system P protein (glycine dehydrogenase) subunit 2